jgi:hypothetical protein
MAFTYTRDTIHVVGNKRRAAGTYTSDSGSTGGAIVTGLSSVDFFGDNSATATPSSVATVSGGTVTLTTTANQTGQWEAIGY